MGDMMLVYNGEDTPAEKMNLAVIGLGTGSMACYARKHQHLTFYDIDPIVKRLSFDKGEAPFPYFSFVQDAKDRGANVDLVMGDARLTMARQQLKDSEKYGFILVDAFSSDAIPIHLISQEALNIYLSKLTEDGVICFHISNRYLDLEPVLYNLAEAQSPNLWAVVKSDNRETDPSSTAFLAKTSSTWVALSRSQKSLEKLRELNDWEDKRKPLLDALASVWMLPDNGTGATCQAICLWHLFDEELCKRTSEWRVLEPQNDWPDLDTVGVWTDDYSNLFSVFSWR
jgi:spermidine synthase